MGAVFKTDAVTGYRRMFYIVSPNETSFKFVEDVPKYIDEASVYFLTLIALEYLVAYLEGKKSIFRLADSITSITAGMFLVVSDFVVKGFDIAVYSWIYENYRLLNLPWDNAWTWLICLFGIDLGYYWCHRMAHEVNFIWAAHQVHHSSEDYNLSTALRQCCTEVFYIPLAPIIPPAIMLVHIEFNLIFQFWVHTQVVDKLGPLEYILNTPSHHRVHHGRNRYCIDKNYAGVFIIWDRMFGTFTPEKEPVVFGLVHPLQTWEPITVQLCHLKYMWHKIWEFETFSDKVAFIFKGPGWEPGKPRLGLIEDIPDIHHPQPKFDTFLPTWCKFYVGFHFLVSFLVLDAFVNIFEVGLTALAAALGIFYIIYTMTCIGHICDGTWYAPWMELIRCSLVLVATTSLKEDLMRVTDLDDAFIQGVRGVFFISMLLWLPHLLKTRENKEKLK
ncbi:putative alkylglycerol monooxygenase [Apostichopus japonicus]|uniref:Alkylglycerol monooxygenase n=1 Tax=Stichopus japonicus TaxID=307972 RepID=A0A2G8LKH7_STIJA|nr:putative alkylglycerol monooxygenase [Apostichopus japonicus]